MSLVLVSATAILGCTKLIPGKCDVESDCTVPGMTHCDPGTKACIAPPTGIGGAGGAAGAAGSMAGAGGARGGAGGAKFSCATAKCGGSTPICDVDAGACRSCGQVSGSCGNPDGGAPFCVPADGGTKAGMCVGCLADTDCAGARPICELDADAGPSRNTCRACSSNMDCAQRSSEAPVCVPASRDASSGPLDGTCVGCLTNADCSGTKPICASSGNACRACAEDSECPSPQVCMQDGHCAADSEVNVVAESATCSGVGTGTTSSPYCTLPMAVSQLSKSRNVILIFGSVSERLTLATINQVNPVVIGRAVGSEAAVIAAGNGAGIAVASDSVLIRDISVSGGVSATGTRGVLLTGSANVTLRRVNIDLGNGGPGIDVETGATLSMDECYVENNPVGGILVNGGTANIQNSVIASNPSSTGYGVQFNSPGSGTQFSFNTVVGYATAATSDFSHPMVLNDSIVVGTATNCNVDNCVTTAPAFSTTSPYHLTGHLPCPVTPTTFPDHDIDGDPRSSTNLDCGADEFVP